MEGMNRQAIAIGDDRFKLRYTLLPAHGAFPAVLHVHGYPEKHHFSINPGALWHAPFRLSLLESFVNGRPLFAVKGTWDTFVTRYYLPKDLAETVMSLVEEIASVLYMVGDRGSVTLYIHNEGDNEDHQDDEDGR